MLNPHCINAVQALSALSDAAQGTFDRQAMALLAQEIGWPRLLLMTADLKQPGRARITHLAAHGVPAQEEVRYRTLIADEAAMLDVFAASGEKGNVLFWPRSEGLPQPVNLAAWERLGVRQRLLAGQRFGATPGSVIWVEAQWMEGTPAPSLSVQDQGIFLKFVMFLLQLRGLCARRDLYKWWGERPGFAGIALCDRGGMIHCSSHYFSLRILGRGGAEEATGCLFDSQELSSSPGAGTLRDGVCLCKQEAFEQDSLKTSDWQVVYACNAHDAALCASIHKEVPLLPPRLSRVAHLYVAGYSYKEIAVLLARAPNTIRTQISEIFRRLSVTNRQQLAHILREWDTTNTSTKKTPA